MARNVIGYSAKTFGATRRVHVKKEILSALQSDIDMRKEISRVFQQANRRIQNIEKSGIASPAVIALNKGDVKGFTKFSMRNDWNTLKMEYAKAVSFCSSRRLRPQAQGNIQDTYVKVTVYPTKNLS